MIGRVKAVLHLQSALSFTKQFLFYNLSGGISQQAGKLNCYHSHFTDKVTGAPRSQVTYPGSYSQFSALSAIRYCLPASACLCHVLLKKGNTFFVCLFQWGRGRGRMRERIPSRIHTQTEPDAGLDLIIPRS